MSIFLSVLVAAFLVATLVALARGLVAFFNDAEHIRQHGRAPGEAIGVKQNRMMSQRVLFQAIAILLVVLISSVAV